MLADHALIPGQTGSKHKRGSGIIQVLECRSRLTEVMDPAQPREESAPLTETCDVIYGLTKRW